MIIIDSNRELEDSAIMAQMNAHRFLRVRHPLVRVSTALENRASLGVVLKTFTYLSDSCMGPLLPPFG